MVQYKVTVDVKKYRASVDEAQYISNKGYVFEYQKRNG